MSLVCSVIFIHHAFNANILDKDYAFSDGEILMVDNAVRTHFEPYERHFKEIGFTENTIKKYIVNMKLAHPWKLKDICDCLYISESLLKKKLKQEQTTFSQILLDARMQHAKNLIRVEGSVNKIAEQCGYASTSYFIYAFRKHFGNSPKRVSKEYRCQSHMGMNTGNTMSALAI